MKLNHVNLPSHLVLSHSARLFAMVFNQQFQFMIILSPEGRVLDVNDLFLSAQQLQRQEYIDTFFWESPAWRCLPERERVWKQRLIEVAKCHDDLITEDIFQLEDGTVRHVDASTRAIFDPSDGQLSGFIVQVRDCTKQRHIDHKIQESDKRLKFILQHSCIGHWEINLIDHTSYRSLIHDQIFGYDSLLPEWNYQRFLDHVVQEDKAEVDRKIQVAIAERSDWNFACQITRKDGQVRWVLVSGGQEFDETGRAKVMAGVIQDITELKQVEIDKANHSATLESLFAALPDMYFRMMPDGLIIDYHTQQQSSLYLKPEEFLGKRMQDLLPDPIGKLFQSKIAEMQDSEQTLVFNYELVINDEVNYFDARLNRISINHQLICVIRDVTDECKAKNSLALSEQRFRTIFEQAAVGVALVSVNSGRFIRINQCFCDMLGYSIAEMLNGKTIKTITFCDDLHISVNQVDAVFGGQQRDVSVEKRYLHKDGHTVWVELTLSATSITEQQSPWVIAVVQDISKRKQADETIQIKQKQLLQAETIGKMGSWEVDLPSLKSNFSSEIRHILGARPLPEVGHLLIREIVFPQDWSKVESSLRDTVELGVLCEMECRIILPTGHKRWVYCKAERQNDSTGKPSKVVGILQDITSRKVEEEKQRLAAAVYKNTSEGVMITDSKGVMVDVNQAFTQLTGYHKQEVVGKTPLLLKSGKHDKAFYAQMWKRLLSEGKWAGEIWNRRKDGSIYPELLNISSIVDDEGKLTHYIGVFSDISSIKNSEEALHHLAHHDALTGLPNRLLLNEYLKQAIKRAKRQQSLIAVIFFDLDNFKIINDSFGHAFGDSLLQETASRLLGCVRENDSVSRISGDEFIILLEDLNHANDAEIAAKKMLNAFQKKFLLDKHDVNVTASMGICIYPQDANNSVALLRNADAAMYQAKGFGRNAYKFYSSEMTNNAIERLAMENSLRKAIKRNEFTLNYQPQVGLQTNSIIGLEVLIRWNHPSLGLVMPNDFIPLAEETGLIVDIGEWVLRTACAQAKAWLDSGVNFGRIAVNVAGPQIKRGNIVALVDRILRETGLPADYLELEVTESYIMKQADKAIEQMQALRQLGVMLSIDDFGTGYSSLSYLKKLPINKLKIDKSFIHDIPNDQDDMAISKAVIALGKALGLKVIAEGVESKEQASFLSDAGCHEVQGYFYSRPVDKDSIVRFLNEFEIGSQSS